MSFNDDQIDYMRSMAKRPPDARCWCAWYPLGECPHCPPDKTLADRLKVQCPDIRCQNYPDANDPTGKITHNIACRANAASTPEQGSKT